MRLVAAMCILGATAHAAPGATLHFDPRLPYDPPLVHVTIGDQPQVFVLDSGAPHHAWSLRSAQDAGVDVTWMTPIVDFYGRSHERFLVHPTTLAVEGLPAVRQPLYAADWPQFLDERPPDAPHVDGALRPQTLPPPGQALLVDLVHGSAELADWPAARDRVAAFERPLADVAALPDGRFVIAGLWGGDPVRLLVDTGAPSTMVYARSDGELPGGAVRSTQRHVRVQAGEVTRDLLATELQPVGLPREQRTFDGRLGMDVLRNCILAMDAQHLLARCHDRRDQAAVGQLVDRPPTLVQLEAGGPWLDLVRRANGGYAFRGQRIEAEIAPDGSVDAWPVYGDWMSHLFMRTDEDEYNELLDATRGLRMQLERDSMLRSSFERLPRHLWRVWQQGTWSPAQKRDILFRIWDEAAEPDDPELGAAGAHARRIIADFVRHQLPRGSPDGYSDAELTQLNARRPSSQPRFDPYRALPTSDR